MKKWSSHILIIALVFIIFNLFQNIEISAESETKSDQKKDAKSQFIPPAPDYVYENWIEPDDEECYRVEINPITPETGITGGLLIIYGHLIKPPYKLEIRQDEGFINSFPKAYVNNIPINSYPSKLSKHFKESRKKCREKYYRREKEDYIKQYSSELLEKREKCDEMHKVIEKKHSEISNLYKKGKLTEREAIIKMREYLDSRKEIKGYHHNVQFIVTVIYRDKDCSIRDIRRRPNMTDEEREKSTSLRKAIWEHRLSNNVTFVFGDIWDTMDEKALQDLIDIYTLSNKEHRIYEIYKCFKNFWVAKYLYYNFNVKEFVEWYKLTYKYDLTGE